jgi:anti-anti-sigma regulatory factor
MIVESYEDVVILSGSLSANHWETIHTAIALTLKRHPSGVIIDCSGLDSMTPEGAETFHSAMQFVREHERARIILAAVPEHVLEVLKGISELRSQLPVVGTVEDARRSLDLLVAGEGTKKTKDPSKPCDKTILATLCPGEWDEHVLEVIADMFSSASTRVIFFLPIIVPRELPLQAPMPEYEEKASAFAERAKEVFRKAGVPNEIQIERAREFSSVVADQAGQVGACHVVVGVASSHLEDDVSVKVFRSLMEKVTQPLLIVRGKADARVTHDLVV